jgi:hypothetical protein
MAATKQEKESNPIGVKAAVKVYTRRIGELDGTNGTGGGERARGEPEEKSKSRKKKQSSAANNSRS